MTVRIEEYSFGSMRIGETVYHSDLVLFRDRVLENWWRISGHSLVPEDLAAVFGAAPDILVVGRGAFGIMRIPASTKQDVVARGIELRAGRTAGAVKIYNQLHDAGCNVAGAFHLTC